METISRLSLIRKGYKLLDTDIFFPINIYYKKVDDSLGYTLELCYYNPLTMTIIQTTELNSSDVDIVKLLLEKGGI